MQQVHNAKIARRLLVYSQVINGPLPRQIVVNFDSGAIAASLSELQAKYDMGHAEAGLIGSMAYIGLVAGAFLGRH